MEKISHYLVNQIKDKRILIVGDLILDKYVIGSVERISPEAPVPIIKVDKEKYMPGGAANVASNISALAANPILFGIVGKDEASKILFQQLNKRKIKTENIIKHPQKQTIQKIRIVSQNQQLLRIDYDDPYYTDDLKQLFANFLKNLTHIDAIILSDYAKGTISEQVSETLINYANRKNIPIVIDPKPQHKSWYKDATILTPNKHETELMWGKKIVDEDDYIKAGNALKKELNAHILITAGANGMFYFSKSSDKYYHVKANAKEVYDVSGAGDTVVATLTLLLTTDINILQAIKIANMAAGIIVGKFGTAQVTVDEILNYE